MTEMLVLRCFEGTSKDIERFQKEKRISRAAVVDIICTGKSAGLENRYALWYWVVENQ